MGSLKITRMKTSIDTGEERESESNLPLSPCRRSHFDSSIVCPLEPVLWLVIHGMTHQYHHKIITHYPKVKA